MAKVAARNDKTKSNYVECWNRINACMIGGLKENSMYVSPFIFVIELSWTLFTWEIYLLCYLCAAVPYFHEVQSNFILVIVWKC